MEIVSAPQGLDVHLLTKQEDHFLDLKSARIAPASLQKHFVAFANTDGGEIYVGLEDEKVVGEEPVQ